MTPQTLTIKNGIITLPRELKHSWQKAEVFVLPTKDALIVKRIEKPLKNLTDLINRVVSPQMSSQEIGKEIQSYRNEKK